MIFLDRAFWTEEKPIYPLIQQLAEGMEYGKLLGLVDSAVEVIDLVHQLKPITPEIESNWRLCRAHCQLPEAAGQSVL
jgi:hypothetical protein